MVGLRVVGEHPLDHDPLLGVGEAGVVVDCDVQVLPACLGAALDAVLEDPLADREEAAELLRVDVQ